MRHALPILCLLFAACPSSPSGGDSDGGGGADGNGGGGDASGPDAGKADAGAGPDAGGGADAGPLPTLGGCTLFPADNPWNQPVDGLAVQANSAAFVARIDDGSPTKKLHADFGSNLAYGIPYNIVPQGQAGVPMVFDYASESDPGPYPIPPNALVEAPTDLHVLVLQQGVCLLWETWDSHYTNPGWHCGSGAKFDLSSNALRTEGWTSADAAGLPILPGLVRYDEVAAGEIRHALRFTSTYSQNGHIHPATHQAGHPLNASNPDGNDPPMGLRLRLKASYDLSGVTGQSLVILKALKKYGLILADNGGSWFISGTSDTRFDDNDLNQLKSVPGSAFEVVDTGAILH